VTELNARIRDLAPVINSPALDDAATVTSSSADVPVRITVRKHGGATYVFAVAMQDGRTAATFSLNSFAGTAKAEVLGENRNLAVRDGRFTDDFEPYAVHLYRFTK
jgi:hypothetical protein